MLVAATWMFPITGLVGGILCELCLRAGQFRQKGWLMLGFFCFNLGFIGDFLPLWFTKESYLEYAAQMMDAGYMATMEGLLNLAGVRGHCTEHSGGFCSGVLAGYEAHA